MKYKLVDLHAIGFLNSGEVQKPTAVEALNFISQNILVFEKSVFQAVFKLMSKIDTILDNRDGPWIKNYYYTKVIVSQDGSKIVFNVRYAITLQCICEILSIYKYVYLEQELDPLEIPKLPEASHINDDDIPKFYKVDVDAKYKMFVESHNHVNT